MDESPRAAPTGRPEVRQGIRLWILKALLSVALTALILFAASGDPGWDTGWLFLGAYVAWQTVTAVALYASSPELLAERSRAREGTAPGDRALAAIMGMVAPAVTWAVAGLDERFGWSGDVGAWVQAAGFAVATGGYALTLWAMLANPFFSATVRIQRERGHTVATSSPYRWVRHPGYVGAILFQLGAPLLLGSLWALVPSAVAIPVFVLRTAREDRVLHEALDGYQEYARRVPYRLVPGIW